ncbi:hypothetical protein [Brevundimonas sp.]
MRMVSIALFGVSAISADGFESPVVFPGPSGAFVPVDDPAPRPEA